MGGALESEGQAAAEVGGDAELLETAERGVVAAADGRVMAEELEVGAGKKDGGGGGVEVDGDEERGDGRGRSPIVRMVGEPAVEDELGRGAAVGAEFVAADEAVDGGEELSGGQALDVVAEVGVGAEVGEEGGQRRERGGAVAASLRGVADRVRGVSRWCRGESQLRCGGIAL